MLAKNYADAFSQAIVGQKNTDVLIQNFVLVLKKRGVLKLLPKILAILENNLNYKANEAVLTIAQKKDQELIINNLSNNIPESVKVKISSSILGGYRLEKNGTFLDKSYQTKLLKLYRTIVKK